MAQPPNIEEIKRRRREMREKAIASFPFERVETSGDRALETWEELKTAGRGAPVVLGSEETIADLMTPFQMPLPLRSIAEILEASARVQHPQDLAAKVSADASLALERLGQTAPELAAMLKDQSAPRVGEWPTKTSPSPGLSVARELRSGKPLGKVQIALVSTDDWTTIPAHLRWGGWNACPYPEYHVAAFRSWRDRYGAELVGMSHDTLNLRVQRHPQTRAEALELASEQYGYCNDIVDQGVGTLSQLAADLMAQQWWFFWWD